MGGHPTERSARLSWPEVAILLLLAQLVGNRGPAAPGVPPPEPVPLPDAVVSVDHGMLRVRGAWFWLDQPERATDVLDVLGVWCLPGPVFAALVRNAATVPEKDGVREWTAPVPPLVCRLPSRVAR